MGRVAAGSAAVAGGRARAEAVRVRRQRRRGLTLAALVGVAGTAATAGLASWGAGPEALGVGAGATGGAAVLLALWARGGKRRDPDRWLRGAAGEAATAALLDALPSRRWSVWHDLAMPGSRANIDHLLVGPTGVWVVDSKAARVRVRAGWREVWLGERRLDPSPAAWEAQVVSDRLSAHLGAAVEARALVAVHGVGLRRRGARVGGVRVVPAAEVTRRLRRGRRRLSRRDRRELVAAVESVLVGGGRV
jgi:hypothetical protein